MLPDWVKEALELKRAERLQRGYAEIVSTERLDAVLYGILMMATKNMDG